MNNPNNLRIQYKWRDNRAWAIVTRDLLRDNAPPQVQTLNQSYEWEPRSEGFEFAPEEGIELVGNTIIASAELFRRIRLKDAGDTLPSTCPHIVATDASSDEVAPWLTENVQGEHAEHWGVYGFADPIEATAFKLRWG